jgi:hypothetical protein
VKVRFLTKLVAVQCALCHCRILATLARATCTVLCTVPRTDYGVQYSNHRCCHHAPWRSALLKKCVDVEGSSVSIQVLLCGGAVLLLPRTPCHPQMIFFWEQSRILKDFLNFRPVDQTNPHLQIIDHFVLRSDTDNQFVHLISTNARRGPPVGRHLRHSSAQFSFHDPILPPLASPQRIPVHSERYNLVPALRPAEKREIAEKRVCSLAATRSARSGFPTTVLRLNPLSLRSCQRW